MKRQYGCGQGVRETQHGHDLSKQLLILAVDGSQRLDATLYLRYTMSLSCVFNIIVVMLLSQVARKDNAGDICPTNPEIKCTNIVARVHLKQPRRAFLFFLLIIRIKYSIQRLFSAESILVPVHILQWQETCLRENGMPPEPNLCWCKLNVLD